MTENKKIIGKMNIDLIKGEFTPNFYLIDEGERMTEKKRFRMEIIEGASLPFIVDNDSAKKQSNKTTSYHTYETDKKNKCLELVELLNTLHEEKEQLQKENEQLKSEINILKTTIGRNEAYIERLTHKSEWHN